VGWRRLKTRFSVRPLLAAALRSAYRFRPTAIFGTIVGLGVMPPKRIDGGLLHLPVWMLISDRELLDIEKRKLYVSFFDIYSLSLFLPNVVCVSILAVI
jgi:hypothetical protein